MKSAKQKGSQAERDIVSLFWGKKEWCAHRIAGSGSSKYPSPDIIAGNVLRTVAIEVKTTKDSKKYFSNDEIEALKIFCKIFGAEPWVAVKFSQEPWYFYSVNDLEKSGNSYKVSVELLKQKGLLFEEFISSFS